MRRIIFGAMLIAAIGAPKAHATTLLPALTITANIATTTSTAVQLKDYGSPENATVLCNFVYGSGGGTADAWVQTSFDGGATWIDVAQCHFAVASLKQIYNLSSLTAVTTVYTPTDGTLSNSTAKDGILGSKWRVKYSSTGTAYSGGTTLQIDVNFGRSRSQP